MTVGRKEAARVGRARSTTAAELGRIGLELFIERGFDEVTVDEIAAAAGIGRRTFFRYFPSKNDLPWGDFDAMLGRMRAHLSDIPADIPLYDALRAAVIDFNTFPDAELPLHRQRMEVLLRTPTLVAHSALRYQSWRQVIADFVAARLGVAADALQPQTIGWACLGISLAAYDQWLAHPEQVLTDLIHQGFVQMREVFCSRAVPGDV
ncbi:mycofactocin system transcriptional regulator [Phytoactinopolyspora halotolerans]|uniref:Mycofactocin system transcriptional regulator n=1 Tax=Phytoactinopolyspora halotolerans TaxID=1981512 RepID=A0A6L9S741_9ACTN|nr:mycofactocin system transcriptional regulator [Phytoactinopolyspora halotolerans]NEE00474.1 mycofactocin system transcriptional regulator [Phytoactinopolyspora halotolerans]